MNINETLQLDLGDPRQNLTNPISMPNLEMLDRNSLQSIDCFNILELTDDVSLFMKTIETKLRMRGECSLSGTSLNLLSEYYLDNLIDISYYNNIIMEVKRLYTIETLINILKECSFSVKNIKTYGINYYIVISRSVI